MGIILSIFVGALCTGICFAVVSCFFTVNDHSGGFLPISDWWFIIAAIALGFGAIIGGLSGAIIKLSNFGLIVAIVFNTAFNSAIFVIVYIVTSGDMSFGIRNTLLSLIPIGTLNAMAIYFSLFASNKGLK